MVNMSYDSASFRNMSELTDGEGAWPIANNRYESRDDVWFPLYEGKMVQSYYHRAADIVIASENTFRTGQGEGLTEDDHRDPFRFATPNFGLNRQMYSGRAMLSGRSV